MIKYSSAILEAPSILGLRPTGVERLSAALLQHGLVERLGARYAGRVDAPDDVMPAVDYRLPDGLTPQELTGVLGAAVASGRAIGLEVTIYNPALDADGRAGRALADVLVAGLADGEAAGATFAP